MKHAAQTRAAAAVGAMDSAATPAALTLVIDIGKSNAKLLLIDAAGELQLRRSRPTPSHQTPHYTALDCAGLQAWLLEQMAQLPGRRRIQRIALTTHGAAFCALGAQGLALPPIDYEWDGYGDWRARYQRAIDPFETTGTPLLPQGLNAGLQLFWLQQAQPALWAQARCWLPYPQYWAWWLSGHACSEVSSLGCHTHLWNPQTQDWAAWARRAGLVDAFAPLRPAWDTLGPLRPGLAQPLGLDPACLVYVGLHDSNACLARHRLARPGAAVVSSGTWTVVMAPAPSGALPLLDPAQEQFFNQSIEQQAVPTARFMGGREFQHLCHGADPSLATPAALHDILQSGWQALAQLAPRPGQRYGSVTQLARHGQRLGDQPGLVALHLRPALAAVYCAFMTAELLQRLWPQHAGAPALDCILEGPMAENAVFTLALAALFDTGQLVRATDELEGTARGAWLSTRWREPTPDFNRYQPLQAPEPALVRQLQQHYQAWRQLSQAGH